MIHFFGPDGPSDYPLSQCIWVLYAERETYNDAGEAIPLGHYTSFASAAEALRGRIDSWEAAPNDHWYGHGIADATGLYFDLRPAVLNLELSEARIRQAVDTLWPNNLAGSNPASATDCEGYRCFVERVANLHMEDELDPMTDVHVLAELVVESRRMLGIPDTETP